LDDLPPMPKDEPRLASLRDVPIKRTMPSFVVEKDGEMPTNPSPRSSQLASRQHTPAPSMTWSTSPAPTSSVPAYVMDDNANPDLPSTPQPIKVKSKKKSTTTGKKKRAIKPEGSGIAEAN